MENKIDPTAQVLLDELTKDSYLDRQKEIVKLLEPYYDIAIPVLVERLKDQGDNYSIRHNALEVLALSSDARSVLPLLRYIEIDRGWTGHIFDYLRRGLIEKDRDTLQKVNAQLIRYLEEGPKIPVPEPFDPVASENSFMEFLGALMKQTGVTELDAEGLELAEEAKEKWMRPIDQSALEKDKIPEHQNVLVETIDTLMEFDGLRDPRLETILSKYIREYGFDSIVAQHALTALSRINLSLAVIHLHELSVSSQSHKDETRRRVIGLKSDDGPELYEFTICAQEPDDPEWKERPYFFRYEKGLVFFLARGEKTYKWFVGHAPYKDNAIQLANEYLARWIQNIDSMNAKHTWTGKYSKIHPTDKYSEYIHLIQHTMNLEQWGFELTYISHSSELSPEIIYDSEWCRVRFSFRGYREIFDQNDILNIRYGRLHATDKGDLMTWNGEPYQCWHHISLALCFLDGMSIKEASEILWKHPMLSAHKEIKETGFIAQHAAETETHAMIWEHYGQRLFELFDLRRPDLWEKYSSFVIQVYDLKGFPLSHKRIC